MTRPSRPPSKSDPKSRNDRGRMLALAFEPCATGVRRGIRTSGSREGSTLRSSGLELRRFGREDSHTEPLEHSHSFKPRERNSVELARSCAKRLLSRSHRRASPSGSRSRSPAPPAASGADRTRSGWPTRHLRGVCGDRQYVTGVNRAKRSGAHMDARRRNPVLRLAPRTPETSPTGDPAGLHLRRDGFVASRRSADLIDIESSAAFTIGTPSPQALRWRNRNAGRSGQAGRSSAVTASPNAARNGGAETGAAGHHLDRKPAGPGAKGQPDSPGRSRLRSLSFGKEVGDHDLFLRVPLLRSGSADGIGKPVSAPPRL